MPLDRHRLAHRRRARARSAGRLGPVLLAAGLVVGVATSVGAQVDPVFPRSPAVWAASCVTSAAGELVVYGRGWGAGDVALSVTDQAGTVVGGALASAVDRAGGAVFQGRVPMAALSGATALQLVATQGNRTAPYEIAVSDRCSPNITARVSSSSCAVAGGPVAITVTVRGASPLDLVLHHADLYGPAETVDRSQPPRPDGDYAFPFTVGNVPDRVIPVTVEARRPNGTFDIATANVGLPPACAQPNPTTTAAPGTTAPPPTPPPTSTTAAPTTAPGPTSPVRPSPFQPGPIGAGATSLALSPTVGRAGDATTVAGRGFAPSTTVLLRWRPGIGQWTVTVGGDGSFRTQVLVLPNDIEGPRVLEVAGGGGAATAPFLVVPRSYQPAFGGVFVSG